MFSDVQVNFYQPNDEEDIVELLQASFPEWQKRDKPIDYWKWKYLDNPHGSLQVLGRVDSKLIGFHGDVGTNIKIGDSIIYTWYGDDAATDPNYRGKGVFSQIIAKRDQIRVEKMKFCYYMTENPILIKRNMKMGKKFFPHTVSHMIKIKDVSLYLKQKGVKNAGVVGLGYNVLRGMGEIKNNRMGTQDSEYKIYQIQRFDDNVNDLWNKTKQAYNFISEKRIEHLNWRYCDPRGGSFQILKAIKDNEMLGFVVTQTRGAGENIEGYVIDLITQPDKMDVASVLLKQACERFEELGVNAINLKAIKGSQIRDLALRNGFVETLKTSPTALIYDYCEDTLDKIIRTSNPHKIYFNYGDYL